MLCFETRKRRRRRRRRRTRRRRNVCSVYEAANARLSDVKLLIKHKHRQHSLLT